MNYLLVVILVIIVAAILAALKAKKPLKSEGLSFDSRDALFTPAERSFLGVLEQVLDTRYRVFGKVRLGDLVKPAKGLSNSKRTTALNRINQKHLDFVICSTADLAVVGVVELDDQSHGREDRAGRDEFVDQALASAKIPVVRFSAKKGYALQDVRTQLAEIIPAVSTQVIVTNPQEVTAPEQPATTVIVASPAEQIEQSAPVCPKCAAVMVKRQASKGEHAGKWFWACSAFPKCRQVVAIEQP